MQDEGANCLRWTVQSLAGGVGCNEFGYFGANELRWSDDEELIFELGRCAQVLLSMDMLRWMAQIAPSTFSHK